MSNQISSTFIERTLTQLKRVWHDLSIDRQNSDALQISSELSDTDSEQLLQWMNNCLNHKGGEVAARRRAAQIGESYLALNQAGRIRFLKLLNQHFDVDSMAVEAAIEDWRQADTNSKPKSATRLRETLEPPRLRLLKQFTELPEGVKFLVDLRAELIQLKKEHPELAALENDLKHLLTSWFDIGLLQLEQINWHSSAEILEKLIAYEAVHAIQSWDDLKNRLDSDRRCFAFFHPNMPNEPLIFVEVALVTGLADNVQKLLDEEAPIIDIQAADTAIFYSISNAQKGLAGISFGNFLIKRVVAELQHDFPNLTQFSTLSPVPGFVRWLSSQDENALRGLPGGKQWVALSQPRLPLDWQQDQELQQKRKEPLLSLAAHYLCQEKRRGVTARDPVAHFHLSNGAELAQINWMADSSENGLNQSAGLMVNYLYDLPHIENRSEMYSAKGNIAYAPVIRTLLKTN
ncbi:malonyl-CoA decarboxylase [uncultured Neptuniibacter sp.]|uniref:malonyl-CoA decarboxylase n=1 Tax=uncultured Neptuniibacter sp. TaxID=502143 RepID=UPI002602C5D9|nr:malonyl-CoA decarboxylase [uncultured Neptuniibacter sp.]